MLQVLSVVGLLQDETDPMVSVMKVQHNPKLIISQSRKCTMSSYVLICYRKCTVFDSQTCAVQVEKAPLESYADVGGLEQQVIEIKEAVELPLTHPELYQDIGIKPPKVQLSLYFIT